MSSHILSLLIAERDKLNAAIAALGVTEKRRGRPRKNALANAPEWVTGDRRTGEDRRSQAKPRKKRSFTAAQREEQRQRMKKYWQEKRKAAKK